MATERFLDCNDDSPSRERDHVFLRRILCFCFLNNKQVFPPSGVFSFVGRNSRFLLSLLLFSSSSSFVHIFGFAFTSVLLCYPLSTCFPYSFGCVCGLFVFTVASPSGLSCRIGKKISIELIPS